MAGHSPMRITYSPAPSKAAGQLVMECNGARHDWAKVADFCAGALGLKVRDKDPVFDKIMAARTSGAV